MQSILQKYLPNVGYAFFRQFSSLLPVQKEAIPIIVDGNNALIISSTGSGKTEAAMAPIMENAISRKDKTHCIYICPTKALVNDIYKRLSPIIETRLGLRIAVRTGDRNTIVRKNKPCVV
ncbi:MAG: DEAD/DEAH box helicase, partial [Methanosarcinales archaeon]